VIIKELGYKDLCIYRNTVLELLIDAYEITFRISREKCRPLCGDKLELLLEDYIKQGIAIVVGAIIDMELVGFLWLYKHDYFGESRLHVNQIAVSPQYRGKGIGKQLMIEAEKQAKSNGIEVIDLFVSEANLRSLNMYDSSGFVTEGRYMKKKL